MSKQLKNWMSLATSVEQEALAKEAGTSRKYLYQLANGARNASADLAAHLEIASNTLSRMSKGRLPKLTRFGLCAACGECPHALRCGIKVSNK